MISNPSELAGQTHLDTCPSPLAPGASPLDTASPELTLRLQAHASTHTLNQSVAWLRANGLLTSIPALCLWLSRTRPSSPDPPHSTPSPHHDDEALHRLGRRFFSSLALTHGDAKAWRLCQRTEIERNRLLLQRDKIHLQTSEMVLRAATDVRLQAIANSPAAHTAKLNQVGQILFGNLWKPI